MNGSFFSHGSLKVITCQEQRALQRHLAGWIFLNFNSLFHHSNQQQPVLPSVEPVSSCFFACSCLSASFSALLSASRPSTSTLISWTLRDCATEKNRANSSFCTASSPSRSANFMIMSRWSLMVFMSGGSWKLPYKLCYANRQNKETCALSSNNRAYRQTKK